MKTLFLVRDFPPDTGGVQHVLGKLAAVWPGEVRVIALSFPGDAAFDKTFPWPVRRVAAFRRLPGPAAVVLRQIAFFLAVCSTWREWRFDRIVCGYLATNGPIAFLWRRLFGVPYVVMTYGMELLRVEDAVARGFWRGVLTRAELVTTIADVFTEFLGRFAPDARAVKIPLGCESPGETDVAFPEPYRGVSLAGRPVVLSVGRLVPRKGFDTALRALGELSKTRPDLVYVAAGGGDDLPRLKKLAGDLGLSDRVVFTGRVDPGELRALFRRADLFVMPSRQEGKDVEGFGIVFIEAGAAGVPVVGGRSGGVPEAVHDGVNGLLADPADPGDVAEKMARILDDPALAARLGEGGRRLAREVFTFKNMRDAMLREIRS